MSREETLEYISHVLRLRREYAGKMEIYLGIERDSLTTDSYESFDYVIGSVHYVQRDGHFFPVDMGERELSDAVNRYYGCDYYALVEDYYRSVAEMAESTLPDVIGHFDLITKFNRDGRLFDEEHPRYTAAANQALERAAECCTVFEMNSGAVFRGWRERPYPSLSLLRRIAALGGQIMLNSDAHTPEAIGFFRREMTDLARLAGFTHECIVAPGGIQQVPLAEMD